jgi:glycosyltransferase involved in cell wall biosynthesis
MACGIPVIASDADPMKRIIKEERCGLTFRSGNSMDLSVAIINIYKDNIIYGRNLIESLHKIYNWEIDEKKMLSLIDGFDKTK